VESGSFSLNVTQTPQGPDELVEAGWQALAAGDIDHAQDASEAALRLDANSIDALSLAAALAVARGDIDESMVLCKKAMEVDPEDPRPYIQAAEAQLYSEDFQQAIEFALKAVDCAGDEADFADAILIKAEAELSQEREDDAKRTLTDLDACRIDEAPLHFRKGQLWLELGEAERALNAFKECVLLEPDSADAHHGLGLACDELGDEAAMLAAWRKVRELDAADEPPPWHLSVEEFSSIALAAMASMHPIAAKHLADIPLELVDTPTEEQVAQGTDPRALGLFEGREDGGPNGPAELERIHLFQINLERACRSQEALEDEIRMAVLHESAHFFALSDHDLDALGLQ